MDEQAKKYPKDWREARWQRAWDLKQKVWKQKDIAEALGVSAVGQWLKRAEESGLEALRRQSRKGAIPRLSSAQMPHLRELLKRGAEARLPRGSLDPTAHGGLDPGGVWRGIPSVACGTPAQTTRLESPAASGAGQPTRRRGETWETLKKSLARRTYPSVCG
jgi:hypothetical protein